MKKKNLANNSKTFLIKYFMNLYNIYLLNLFIVKNHLIFIENEMDSNYQCRIINKYEINYWKFNCRKDTILPIIIATVSFV